MSWILRIFSVLAVIYSVLFGGMAIASDTPEQLAGAVVVDADKVKVLQAAGADVFDVRVANEYVDGHIKNAISLPYQEKSKKEVGFDASLDKFDSSKLGSDKNKAIVIYCNGPECWKSYKASVAAIKAGYNAIHWFRSVFPAWQDKTYAVDK